MIYNVGDSHLPSRINPPQTVTALQDPSLQLLTNFGYVVGQTNKLSFVELHQGLLGTLSVLCHLLAERFAIILLDGRLHGNNGKHLLSPILHHSRATLNESGPQVRRSYKKRAIATSLTERTGYLDIRINSERRASAGLNLTPAIG